MLQRVQNMTAKVVLNQSKYSSTTEAFRKLHWLPIRERIEFKIMCMVWKSLHGMAPPYLSDLLCRNNFHERNLRSSDNTDILIVPWVKNKLFAYRSFSVTGPRRWNSLPNSFRKATTLESFKSQLKTHHRHLYYVVFVFLFN